ncbi:hypothetical protein [Rhodophyticola porphyridii]|uniref:Uncharacterized protein n=1 Tax=Rhodophyticola porphyridii TaxID=1852017 RepID=A0A3L9YA46_9RHOB|nr:hypothetical protein [Rhodophyticola porphyridii]RMA44158.1 hypothetical protein D9R08_04485 [Rhodophyticola porphyridii]
MAVVVSTAASSHANGFGEAQGFQFRSSAERQTLILQEQVRLQFRGSGSALGGQGVGQTGNQTTITINGNGNNTIDLMQDNSGDQSIVEVDGNDNQTNGASPSAVISGAAATLMATP